MILKPVVMGTVLALCLGQGAAAQGFFDNLKGAIGGDQKPAQETTYLDQFSASRASCGGTGQTS